MADRRGFRGEAVGLPLQNSSGVTAKIKADKRILKNAYNLVWICAFFFFFFTLYCV